MVRVLLLLSFVGIVPPVSAQLDRCETTAFTAFRQFVFDYYVEGVQSALTAYREEVDRVLRGRYFLSIDDRRKEQVYSAGESLYHRLIYLETWHWTEVGHDTEEWGECGSGQMERVDQLFVGRRHSIADGYVARNRSAADKYREEVDGALKRRAPFRDTKPFSAISEWRKEDIYRFGDTFYRKPVHLQ